MTEIGTFCRADRLRLATLFQSTEETRYYLNGVHIQSLPDGGVRLEATDGHRAVLFRDDAGFTCAPCIVALPKAARAAIKSVKAREFLWFGILGQHDGKGRHEARVVNGEEGMASLDEIRAAMLDATNPAVIWSGAVDLIDGMFPDIERVIPAHVGDAAPSAAFQGRYMADFTAVATDDGNKAAWVAVHVDGNGPALVRCARADFVGVVMPMAAGTTGALVRDGALWTPPAWVRAGLGADEDVAKAA